MHTLKNTKQKDLRSISIEDKILQGLTISPDGRFISYRLSKPPVQYKEYDRSKLCNRNRIHYGYSCKNKSGCTRSDSLNFLFMTGKRILCWL